MAQTADERMTIRISSETKRKLKEKAREDGRSLSSWAVRKLLMDDDPSGKKRPGHSN